METAFLFFPYLPAEIKKREVIFLTIQRVEITDIFRGAYLLCSGGDLDGIRINNRGKRIASFSIRGENLTSLDRAYRSGEALVNPLQLRESLNHLRDMLFEKMRENEGRVRYDRKRIFHSSGCRF